MSHPRRAAAAVLAFFVFFLGCARDPDRAPEVAWDRATCDGCGMMLSEPRFAAQIVERGGRARVFDDAGCLFQYVAREAPAVEQMWFHDHATAEDRWYRTAEVAFVDGLATPMGSGLGAVAAGSPGSMTMGEASGKALLGKQR